MRHRIVGRVGAEPQGLELDLGRLRPASDRKLAVKLDVPALDIPYSCHQVPLPNKAPVIIWRTTCDQQWHATGDSQRQCDRGRCAHADGKRVSGIRKTSVTLARGMALA